MPLLNCKCCGVKAEPNSDYCYICLGRGHDEEDNYDDHQPQSSEGSTFHVDVSESTPPLMLPNPSPATIDIDEILETLEMKANNYGIATKATPDHVVAEAKAQITDLITEKENRARVDELSKQLHGSQPYFTKNGRRYIDIRFIEERLAILKSKGKTG